MAGIAESPGPPARSQALIAVHSGRPNLVDVAHTHERLPSRRVNRLGEYSVSLLIAALGILAVAGFATTSRWVLAALTVLVTLVLVAEEWPCRPGP